MIPESLKQTLETIIPSMEGWCTPEKAVLLANLIEERKPKVVVESGIFGGRSLIAMGLALRLVGSGTVTGIDPWSLDAALEGNVGKENAEWWQKNVDLEKIYVGFVQEILARGLTPQCRWIRSKSDVVSRMFDNGSVHFFHQDSNHSEEVSCLEVKSWHKKMAPNSIWVLDDSDWLTQAKAIELIKQAGFKVINQQPTFTVFSNGN